MIRKDVIGFQGKKVKILLENRYNYNGTIFEISEDCFKIKDKFSNVVLIKYCDVAIISEVNGGIE